MLHHHHQVLHLLLPLCVGILAVQASDDAETSRTCATNLQQLIDVTSTSKPFVTAPMWLPSGISDMNLIDIKSSMAINPTKSSCRATDDGSEDPIVEYEDVVIGQMPQMNETQALEVLDTANKAWDKGTGVWPTKYTSVQRIDAIHKVLEELKNKREEIVQVLQWEIGKNYLDAAAEFDRTIQFAKQVMNQMVTNPEYLGSHSKQFTEHRPSEIGSKAKAPADAGSTASYMSVTKRTPIGIFLMLAPYNYPINECFATLIPALLLGNICIVKIPSVGGLAHLLTMEAFSKFLPHGTVNFIAGSGATVLPSILETGDIHGLAMIGSSKSADQLLKYHPQHHRLHKFLQLGAKNVGVILPDVFNGVTEQKDTSMFKNMITESILGSLSYNGQRCTALKIFFVPKQHADLFVRKLAKSVESLNIGLPWQNHTATKEKKVTHSQVTPLPNQGRIKFLKGLIDDAVKKGATIANTNGGTVVGGSSSTLMVPAILYPVNANMKLYTEEQFGPVIPVVTYDDISEVYEYIDKSEFAQQISVFGLDSKRMTEIVDRLGSTVPKINFNSQCARSPDILPFAARRSSGLGVMSVTDVLQEFSIPTVLAYQNKALNDPIGRELFQVSTFLGANPDLAATY